MIHLRRMRLLPCPAVLSCLALFGIGCASGAPVPPPSGPAAPEALHGPDAGAPASTASVAAAPELEGVLNRPWLERLGVPEAWKASRGEGVTVAVIDNGFYPDDPLMAGAYLDDQLQFTNVVHRQDILCAAHGSSMAATIAARPNGAGTVAGVAPGAKILRISSGCPKWVELDLKQTPREEQDRLHLEFRHELAQQSARALDWAAERGARIVSFSTPLDPPNAERLPASLRLAAADREALEQAIERARARGVLMVVAAGNWAGIKQKAEQPSWDSKVPQLGLYFPASSPAAVAAGCACGDPGQTCEYMHTGAQIGQPQIAAVMTGHNYGPGLDFVGYCDGVPMVSKRDGRFDYTLTQEGGTSNAAPELSGVLALVWSRAPQASADQVLKVLEEASTDLGAPGNDEHFGFGVPNAARAVQLAAGIAGGPH